MWTPVHVLQEQERVYRAAQDKLLRKIKTPHPEQTQACAVSTEKGESSAATNLTWESWDYEVVCMTCQCSLRRSQWHTHRCHSLPVQVLPVGVQVSLNGKVYQAEAVHLPRVRLQAGAAVRMLEAANNAAEIKNEQQEEEGEGEQRYEIE